MSFLCYSDSLIAQPPAEEKHARFGKYGSDTPARILTFLAFYDRDPVDVALDWAPGIVPVIMPANDKRAGGDWEASQFLSPGEASICLLTEYRCYGCRRMSLPEKQSSCNDDYTGSWKFCALELSYPHKSWYILRKSR